MNPRLRPSAPRNGDCDHRRRSADWGGDHLGFSRSPTPAPASRIRCGFAAPGLFRDVYVDARDGGIIRSINLLHSQSAIGQGTGVLGALRKMSTNRTSSIYQAVDKLRLAEGYTLDFRGSPGRLNQFLQSGATFNSDIATDSDNTWDDAPTVDAHVYQGWVYDYYYKRFGRRGMDDRNLEVDSVVHPLARSEASRHPRHRLYVLKTLLAATGCSSWRR